MRCVVKRGPDDCWRWIGPFAGKYGQIGWNGENIRAHRLSYQLFVGEIPFGFLVCHRCDNPECVNPRHLFVGTGQDNTRDCARKGRLHRQQVAALGWRGEHARFDNGDARELLRLHNLGYSQRAMGKQFGCSRTAIVTALAWAREDEERRGQRADASR